MKKKFKINYGALIALLGAVMMGYGVFLGEPESVFSKAIRICLECIGIG